MIPMLRKSQGKSVQRRVVRNQWVPSSPETSAANANAKGIHETHETGVEHEGVDHHDRVLEQRVESVPIRERVAGLQEFERLRDESDQNQKEDRVGEEYRRPPRA